MEKGEYVIEERGCSLVWLATCCHKIGVYGEEEEKPDGRMRSRVGGCVCVVICNKREHRWVICNRQLLVGLVPQALDHR
jgi:hypothetical protein